MLPARIHDQVLWGLMGADVLGFHSPAWAENFLLSARQFPGARVDLARSRIVTEGREVTVRIHPISVDGRAMREEAATPRVRSLRHSLNRWRDNNRLILRVDRLELTKNVVRGFQAYELFLRRNPSWIGRVRFLALLSPSRMELPEYREYTEACLAEARRVNDALGRDGWMPIELRLKDDYIGAIAAYGLYDVLFVNPVIDGMNLVAMEGPLLNRRRGVLVLSRNAGAYGRLGRYALPVNPFDIDEMADALERGDHDAGGRAHAAFARALPARAREPARAVGRADSSRISSARSDGAASRPASERPQELDEPGRALGDHVGRVDQRRRRLRSPDGDADRTPHRLRSRQPVERGERVEIGVIVARVQDRLEPVLARRAVRPRRPSTAGPAGRARAPSCPRSARARPRSRPAAARPGAPLAPMPGSGACR